MRRQIPESRSVIQQTAESSIRPEVGATSLPVSSDKLNDATSLEVDFEIH